MRELKIMVAVGAVCALLAACSSGRRDIQPVNTQGATSKEIVINTDKGEAAAQDAGTKACGMQGKRAELTGYTCAEGTCKVLRYTFDCV